jgi:uncharacterized sporulation protein YeaH/YhbH (DUF444 family)
MDKNRKKIVRGEYYPMGWFRKSKLENKKVVFIMALR